MTTPSNNNEFEKVSKTLGVELPSFHRAEEFFEILSEDKIKAAQLKTLIAIHPGIVNASVEAMKSLVNVSQTAGNSQAEAIKALSSSMTGALDAMMVLAQNAQSDSTREKLAVQLIQLSKQHQEQCLMIKTMNGNNNGLWRNIAASLGGVALLVVGGFAAAAKFKK